MKTSMLIKKCIYVVKITYYIHICCIQNIYTKNMIMERETEKTSKIDKNNTKNMIMERETEKKNIQVQL